MSYFAAVSYRAVEWIRLHNGTASDDIAKYNSWAMLSFSISLVLCGLGNYFLTSRKMFNPFLAIKVVVSVFIVAMLISLTAVYTETYWLYFFTLAMIGFCESTG